MRTMYKLVMLQNATQVKRTSAKAGILISCLENQDKERLFVVILLSLKYLTWLSWACNKALEKA